MILKEKEEYSVIKSKGQIIANYVNKLEINIETTCKELCDKRDTFTEFVRNEFGSAIGFSAVTESLLSEWFSTYFNECADIKVLPETKYTAAIGSQKLDIPILKDNQISLGISVKARTETSGYLDGADFQNPLIKEFDQYLKEGTDGKIGVPTYLQDMARIENLQNVQVERFKSLTITYGKLNNKNVHWIDKFTNRFNHRYIFLLDEGNRTLKEVYEREIQSMK